MSDTARRGHTRRMADLTFLPLHTERLTLRAFTADDTATFAAYRNDPEVARYQDWELPVDPEGVARFVASQLSVTGPVPGDWVQIAVEFDGELAGDVAVGLDPSGALAIIGYTVRRDRQGRGIGREAVAALVDALFDSAGVQRVAATVDPANIASAHLLERLGFRYEGCAKAAALVRGSWADDDRYAMLRADREAWLARPTGRPDDVRLVEVTADSARVIGRLATAHTQERFVASVLGSFRDALFPGTSDDVELVPWLRAIEADGEPAGFLMIADSTAAHPEPYLWRMLIDARHQRRGIGARAIALLVERLRAKSDRRLLVSWVDEPGGPAPFYRGLGFAPTGRIHGGEVEAALDLA